MKRKIVLAAVCFAAYSLLVTFSPVFAATTYSGAWIAEEGDQVDVELSAFGINTTGFCFGVYDWGTDYHNASNRLALISQSPESSWFSDHVSVTVNYNDSTNIWSIGSLDLTDDAKFGLYFSYIDGSNTLYVTEYGYEYQDNNLYRLYSGIDGVEMTVISDADPVSGPSAPVPVPTALVLFGSGLVGLVGFRRKTVR